MYHKMACKQVEDASIKITEYYHSISVEFLRMCHVRIRFCQVSNWLSGGKGAARRLTQSKGEADYCGLHDVQVLLKKYVEY